MSHMEALKAYRNEDYSLAKKLWINESDNDNDQAMVNLGLLYLKGEGVQKDFALAKEWFLKATKYENAVNIMTVHTAKGLEFDTVFIPYLINKKFPSTERTDPIELPSTLIKETLPEGDIHLEEERRLFYVAATRAKKQLILKQGLGLKRLLSFAHSPL